MRNGQSMKRSKKGNVWRVKDHFFIMKYGVVCRGSGPSSTYSASLFLHLTRLWNCESSHLCGPWLIVTSTPLCQILCGGRVQSIKASGSVSFPVWNTFKIKAKFQLSCSAATQFSLPGIFGFPWMELEEFVLASFLSTLLMRKTFEKRNEKYCWYRHDGYYCSLQLLWIPPGSISVM